MTKPWYLVKKGRVWQYRLASESTYHTTGKRIKAKAEMLAAEQFRVRGLSAEAGTPFGVYQRVYYTEDCPRCARLADEKKPVDERWRKMRRACLDRLAEDPIMRKAIDRIIPGDLLDMRRRLHGATFYDKSHRKNYQLSDAAINRHVGAVKMVLREAFLRRDIMMDPTAGTDALSWSEIASSQTGTRLAALATDGDIWTSNDSGVTWIDRTTAGSRA